MPIYVKFDPPFDNESYDQMYYTIYSLWNRIAEGTGATQYVNDNTKVFIELPDSSIDYTGYRVLFKNDLTSCYGFHRIKIIKQFKLNRPIVTTYTLTVLVDLR